MLLCVTRFWTHPRLQRCRVQIVLLLVLCPLQAQQPEASPPVSQLVQDAVKYQLADLQRRDWVLRYKLHRVDSKEDTLRDLIESSDGNVARTLERNGRPLLPEEDAAEQGRLRAIVPEDYARRHRRGTDASEKYGADLIGAMPDAMVYSLAAGQPQLSAFDTAQVVLDYVPRPGWKPATTTQSLLTGLAGRLWIDAGTHHLLRIEVHITHNLNLAFGLLARVYQGGTLLYEQHPLGGDRYAYSHIEINVVLRELMVKTVPYHSTLDASDVTLLPAVPTLPQAIDLLLRGPAAKHP